MRLCEWCEAPMDEELPPNTKYCCYKCKLEANALKGLFCRHPGLPNAVRSQEYGWNFLFRRLSKAKLDMTLVEVLSPQEWGLMIDLIEESSHRRLDCPNGERLIQLEAIGEKLLAIPMSARWDKVPANTRARISWYASKTMGTWSRIPKALIPSKIEKAENQTRKKRR